jgi:hypothetical protein
VSCRRVREQAATALLTRSTPDDEAAAHLQSCQACRQELERLAEVGDLLAVLHPDAAGKDGVPAVLPVAAPPAELLDGILAAASTRRPRRHQRRLMAPLAAAAAAVALIVPAGLWINQNAIDDSPPPAAGPTSAAPAVVRTGYDQDWHVRATIELRGTARGSDLSAQIGGVRVGTECTVRVVTATGDRQAVGSWVASYSPSSSGIGTVHGSVPVPPAELTRVEIVDEAKGDVLLTVKL